MLDWIRACKDTKRRAPISVPPRRTQSGWLLLAVALHFPGKLEWKLQGPAFTNSPEANRKPIFRKGSELKL
jgi:hypothetical protein